MRRRDGVDLAELWEALRQQVEERPTGVAVVVRVRRERRWAVVGLRFAAVPATRTLLSFGADVEVVSPPEVRADLAAVAAAVVAQYT